MAIERANIDLANKGSETFKDIKLYTDEFNSSELEKSVNTKVTELIKPLPKAKLDLVPKPIYDAEVELNGELNRQIADLNTTVEDLTTKLNQKTADSGSLYVSNDFLKVTNASLENNLASQNNIVSELRTGLSTAIQKSISENAERTGLEAENAGLAAQKTALLKQIDTLNNLVQAAGASLESVQSTIINTQRDLTNSQQLLAQAQIENSNAQARASAAQSARIQSELANTRRKKIICNELYNQGYLPEHIWNADERYGNMMFDKDPTLVLGYMMWARDVVKFMKEKPKYNKWIYTVVKPWSEHMAYEMGELPNDNFIGKIIHNVGKHYSYYVYNQTMSKRNLAY
jgi:hypothetical protein